MTTPSSDTSDSTATKTALHLHSRSEIAEQVDRILEQYYQTNRTKAERVHSRYEELLGAMHELTSAGGKRARPYVSVLTYEAYGGKRFIDICTAGAALEVLHSAMLIHDDIIDRDQVRYGVDNISGRYRKLYGDKTTAPEAAHYADSAALLAGDLNISGAHQLVLESGFGAEQKILVVKLLGEALFKVIGGELIDTDAALYADEETDPLAVAKAKTAHYSFVTPMLVGATLAGANEDELAKLETLGIKLGTAFQFADDMLGVFGEESQTGKSNSSDMREGRRTQLIRNARSMATPEQLDILDELYGKHDLSDKEAKTVRDILTASGAKDAVQRQIESYAEEARAIVTQLDINESSQATFENFIGRMVNRDA